MRGAKMEDIQKVIRVIKQQLVGSPESSLKKAPLTLKAFEDSMYKETYGKVKDAWQEESTKTRQNSQVMKDLKSTLQPLVIDRIKEQRLAQMESGTRFSKYRRDGGGKERGKEIYCKLDASHKTLHYKDVNESDKDPEYEELLTDDTSIPVSNIEGLRTGMDLLAPSDGGYGAGGAGMATDGGDVFTYVSGLTDLVKSAERAFAITYKKEVDYAMRADGNANEQHSLILLAKDQTTYDVWSDGINFLLGNSLLEKEKKTKLFESELDILLNIDLRMNILNPCDTFNFEALPIAPPPPTNYNFTNFKICKTDNRVMIKSNE